MGEVTDRIEVKIVATQAVGDVPVDDFLAEVGAIYNALVAIDEDLNSKRTATWKIVDLHHSDAVVVFGNDTAQSSEPIARTFFSGLDALANGNDDESLSEFAIDAIRTALRPIGRSIQTVQLQYAEIGAMIDSKLKKAFERISFKSDHHFEEWEGLLEEINVHSETPSCRLYMIAGPRWLPCTFQSSDIPKFQSALTHKVSLSGVASYRPNARFPHKLAVTDIKVFGQEAGDLREFLGVFSENEEEIFEGLKQARNGWGS
ncbi:hypothetical protein RFN25_07055 [Mesorhizobium abyssinicae]|uniref:hypothetical protein n=1 Tax=Mesorhizobium abyssinicae TaxID=1209958 RepID=UPI002A249853|nr:hypothetical protein [Mesorhizobium abyssinicae]MDX8433191.1 hypothetical protein [Mesorhizobium abyssinicae]